MCGRLPYLLRLSNKPQTSTEGGNGGRAERILEGAALPTELKGTMVAA